MSDGIRAMWMRGGTSKGGYFLASDLPADTAERDAALLRSWRALAPLQSSVAWLTHNQMKHL